MKVYQDRLGNPLKDGDLVLSFNLMAPDESWPLKNPRVGVRCTFRIVDNYPWVYPEGGGRSGCPDPENSTYGVELIGGRA